MRKSIAVAVLVLALAGCSASDPATASLEACKEAVDAVVGGDQYDWSEVETGNMAKELFEAGITDSYDASDEKYMVVGDVEVTTGNLVERQNVICYAEIVDGKAELTSEPTINKL